MALADTNRTAIRSKAESTWGTAATGNYQIERLTGESLIHDKATVPSNELRSDRQVPFLAEVGAGASGAVNFELSYGSYDSWLESLLYSTWQTPSGGARQTISCTLTNSPNQISGTGVGTDIVVGQYVRLDGNTTPANDGWYLVTVVDSANLVTVAEAFDTPEGPTSIGYSASYIRNGTTEKSLTIERQFTDVTSKEFTLFTGMIASSMSMAIAESAIITGSFNFLGKEGALADATAAGTPVAATTTDVINATSNVGQISETYGLANRTALSTAIQAINFTIDGSLRHQRAIANRTAVGVGEGRYQATGNVNAYFEDGSLFEKYVLHTATSLSIRMHDGATGDTAAATLANRVAGNTYIVTFPRVFFSSGGPQAGATDQDVFANLNFQAVLDSETGVTVQVDRFAATP